jgi:hypothetical protein
MMGAVARREPTADVPAAEPEIEPVADGAEGADGRAAEGFGHLQAAAHELIQAARALLDVVEELVDDPATVGAVTDAVGSIVRQAARAGRQAAGGGRAGDPDAGARRPTGVERIRVG